RDGHDLDVCRRARVPGRVGEDARAGRRDPSRRRAKRPSSDEKRSNRHRYYDGEATHAYLLLLPALHQRAERRVAHDAVKPASEGGNRTPLPHTASSHACRASVSRYKERVKPLLATPV